MVLLRTHILFAILMRSNGSILASTLQYVRRAGKESERRMGY